MTFSITENRTRHTTTHGECGHRNPHELADATGELERQRHPADLRGDRHEVDQKRGRQIGRGHPRSQSCANDLESGTTAHGGHSSRHLSEQIDPDDPSTTTQANAGPKRDLRRRW